MPEVYQYPLKIEKQIMEQIRVIAKQDGRSVNKEIEFILREYIKKHSPQTLVAGENQPKED